MNVSLDSTPLASSELATAQDLLLKTSGVTGGFRPTVSCRFRVVKVVVGGPQAYSDKFFFGEKNTYHLLILNCYMHLFTWYILVQKKELMKKHANIVCFKSFLFFRCLLYMDIFVHFAFLFPGGVSKEMGSRDAWEFFGAVARFLTPQRLGQWPFTAWEGESYIGKAVKLLWC